MGGLTPGIGNDTIALAKIREFSAKEKRERYDHCRADPLL